MIDIYDFIDRCREDGLTVNEAMNELAKVQEEERQMFFEDYYSNPEVNAGLVQQDLIDSYRRER